MENNDELNVETTEADEAEPRVYEVGYHIIPSVAEESVSTEAAALKANIEKLGGVIISEEAPRHMPLAYAIERITESRRESFTSAHFGSIKFEIDPAQVIAFKEMLDGNKLVLRYIIFKTVREHTRSDVRPTIGRPERPERKPAAKAPVRPAEEAKPVSQAELDRTIDELVVE